MGSNVRTSMTSSLLCAGFKIFNNFLLAINGTKFFNILLLLRVEIIYLLSTARFMIFQQLYFFQPLGLRFQQMFGFNQGKIIFLEKLFSFKYWVLRSMDLHLLKTFKRRLIKGKQRTVPYFMLCWVN